MKHDMHSVMQAVLAARAEGDRPLPVLTSNQCHALAQELNKGLPTDEPAAWQVRSRAERRFHINVHCAENAARDRKLNGEEEVVVEPLYMHADSNLRWHAVATEQRRVIEGLQAALKRLREGGQVTRGELDADSGAS